MSARRWTVGVDFGGTNIKVGLVNAAGRVVRTQRLASQAVSRPSPFVDAVSRTVDSLAQSVGVRTSQLRGVGVGAPGPVDASCGVVHSLVNVPGWRDVPLARQLERRLRCRCAVDNDVNLFALGEWRFGAGRGSNHLVCLTLGTGVGGGLVLNGALYRGAAGAAGELGHMVIDPRGRRCGCGKRGCLEAQVGTAAILRMGREALRQRPGPLRALCRQARGHLTPELVSRAAHAGDRGAQQVWRAVGRWLGLGLANVTNLLNPDRIVIGGGVANAWDLFAPIVKASVRAQAMEVSSRAVQIVRARLGNSAGVVGAAVLVWEETRGEGRGARGRG